MLGLKAGESLVWGDVEFREGGVAVQIRKSKTDQRAVGKEVSLPRFTNVGLSPLYWGRRLKGEEQETQGQVFRHANKATVTAFQLLSVLRKALRYVGEDPEAYGTHSFRIGAASEAKARGWGSKAIRELGRWSSDCYKGYVRNLEGDGDNS